MGHTAVTSEHNPGSLYLFGGDIRVSTDHGEEDKKLNDFWELDVDKRKWTRITGGPAPPARGFHTAVAVSGGMLVYGGQGDDHHWGDLWKFTFQNQKWELLIPDPQDGASAEEHPGKRGMHSAVAAPNGQDMYIYGGFRWDKDKHNEKQGAFAQSDLWLFSSSEKRWKLVPQVASQGRRSDFGMVLYPYKLDGDEEAQTGIVTYAGTQCNPDCNMVPDLAFYSFKTESWHNIEAQNVPMKRYRHTFVVYKDSLLTFGGESYTPHMYHNSVQRIDLLGLKKGWQPRQATEL